MYKKRSISAVHHPTGNYGNQIDGVSKPSSAKKKKKDGENEEEENELIQNSSEDEADEESDLVSVSCTPPMKPVITDRSGVAGARSRVVRKQFVITCSSSFSPFELAVLCLTIITDSTVNVSQEQTVVAVLRAKCSTHLGYKLNCSLSCDN